MTTSTTTYQDEEITLSADVQLEPAPEGVHPAVCVDVINLGEEEEAFDNQKPRKVRKLGFVWQVFPEDGSRDSAGRPFIIDAKVTASVNDGARLRLMLESWRGKPYSPDDLKSIQPMKVKGQACLIEVYHSVRLGNIYANIKDDMVRGPAGQERKFANITPYSGPALKPEPEHYEREWIVKKYERMNAGKANKASASQNTSRETGNGKQEQEDFVPF